MFENQGNILKQSKTIFDNSKTSTSTKISTSMLLDSHLKAGNINEIKKMMETTKFDPIIAESTLYKLIKNKEIPIEIEMITKLLWYFNNFFFIFSFF